MDDSATHHAAASMADLSPLLVTSSHLSACAFSVTISSRCYDGQSDVPRVFRDSMMASREEGPL